MDFREPALAVNQMEGGDADDDYLSSRFSKMKMGNTHKAPLKMDVDDDESTESLNDFHLAEIDLVECFQRTNILQRMK